MNLIRKTNNKIKIVMVVMFLLAVFLLTTTSTSALVVDITNPGQSGLSAAGAPYATSLTNEQTAKSINSIHSAEINAGAQPLTANEVASIKPTTDSSEEIFCFRWLEGFNIPGCLAILSYFLLFLSSWVLWLTALAFDWTIQWSLSMRDIIDGFGTIQYGWEVLRNFINLFFILILVYISIATILRIENYGYKKLLGKLVIAAFLINFSMFFTKIIIDVSNITALVFYSEIMKNAKEAGSSGEKAGPDQKNWLSLGIMNSLGLSSVWGVANSQGATALGNGKQTTNNPAVSAGASVASGLGGTKVQDPWTMILVGLGGTVFVLILSFVFFAATIMLLLRVIVLILLIITSPAAFAANVLPKTSQYADKWWKQLTSNALFAPVYMMLLFITLKMIWGNGNTNKTNNLLSVFAGGGDSAGIGTVVTFVFLCAMLVMCLVVASSFGTLGAKTVQGWGKSLGTKGKNFAINRATLPVSYLADKASKSSLLARVPLVGGALLQGADKLAQQKLGGDSSYRSRMADSKKMYQTRGDLIKNARNGTITRRIGEDEETFQARKKKEEEPGNEAQKRFFGVDKNGTRKSTSWLSNAKNQASEEFLNAEGKKKTNASAKVIEREQNGAATDINQLVSISEASERSGHMTIGALNAIKVVVDGMKEGGATEIKKSDIKSNKLYDLISKVEEPLLAMSRKIGAIEREMTVHAQTIRTHNPATTSPAVLEEAEKKLKALSALHTVEMSHKTGLHAVAEALKGRARRMDDVAVQGTLKGAIEDNKPKS